MEEQLITLGMSLAKVVSRNSISFVGDKMKLSKEKKDLERGTAIINLTEKISYQNGGSSQVRKTYTKEFKLTVDAKKSNEKRKVFHLFQKNMAYTYAGIDSHVRQEVV